MRRHALPGLDFASFNSQINLNRDVKIIAIDATTIKKSGKSTYGLSKFWSSCVGKAVHGIEYSCVALIDPNSQGHFICLLLKHLLKVIGSTFILHKFNH